jgi:hypothetical protein
MGNPGGLGGLWAMYLKAMDSRPFVTKVVTSASLNGLGDILGQSLFEKDKPFDWARLAKFTFLVRCHVLLELSMQDVAVARAYRSSVCV